MKVISTERLPIKMWLEEIEENAMVQIKNLANLPFAFKHVAIMPDSHCGYGMPIGGVLATEGVIIPNAVGVDIGCGMSAMRLDLTDISRDLLKGVMGEIRNKIPVGFEHRKESNSQLMPDISSELSLKGKIIEQQYASACKQLGTLGGGNHFIEIQKGSDGFIWVMIHSGSRNLGKQVCDYYNGLAECLNERWHTSVPIKQELAFLPMESAEAKAYKLEMDYCLAFSTANRDLMMRDITEIFFSIMGATPKETINIQHNYAQWENHFGKNVIIHRKGATSAREGEIGIIPGSQGTKSYIVKGKGNPDSFMSCSHGAGRKMGRKQAERELNLEEEVRKLDEQGILHAIRGKKDLDEASGAYKDIDMVMRNQMDLVDIVVELSPLGVIKG
jgi:tRNA-splicing ligase RtcB